MDSGDSSSMKISSFFRVITLKDKEVIGPNILNKVMQKMLRKVDSL